MASTETVIGAGIVRRGRLCVTQIPALASLRDGPVEITVSRRRATRSQVQNNYYWGAVMASLAEHTGYTPDEIHEICKSKFIPKRLAVADGNGEVMGEFVIGGTTTRLTTLEFGEYVERIRAWAMNDLGVVIPDPECAA